MSQQSSLELCLATSSRVYTLDISAAAAAGAARVGWTGSKSTGGRAGRSPTPRARSMRPWIGQIDVRREGGGRRAPRIAFKTAAAATPTPTPTESSPPPPQTPACFTVALLLPSQVHQPPHGPTPSPGHTPRSLVGPTCQRRGAEGSWVLFYNHVRHSSMLVSFLLF
jgi:hypothetical protein